MSTPKTHPASRRNLTEGSIERHLIRLTLPMTWGIFAIISFQLVDTFYISLLGTTELAALSLTFPITMAVFSLFIGFQIAMASVGSRLIGGGDMETMRRVTTHSVLLVFVLGMIIAALGLYFHDPIFRLVGANDESLPLVWSYMSVWFAGAVFVTVPMIGNAAMRADGDSFTPAVVMTIVAFINIILDPILIFGLFGFPRLELQGAAMATIFANACAMVTGLYINYFRKNLLCSPFDLQLDKFKDSAKRLLFIALPAGLTNTIQPLVNAFIFSMLAVYGEEAIAAFGVATRIEAFCFVILMALATGMAPIIGQNWGAQKFDRVHHTLKVAIRFNFFWSLFVALVLIVFGRQIAGIFTDDPEIIKIMVLFFMMVPASYAFGNLIMGWGSAFNAMGKPARSVMMIVTRMVILLIPALYIGQHFFGIMGIFGAIAAVNVAAGIFFHLMNWRYCKRQEETIQQ
ncbi:MAG: MATE family efflux transporter [Alphaproteobacteria bacterium]